MRNGGKNVSSKAKGVVALILVVAVLANVGIFAKMSYNKTHTAQETIVFRVGDTVASDHPISQALYMFEEELERISNGRFDVRVYINSALGGDRQQTESVILGYMQGNTPPTSVLAGFDTRFMVVDLPFVFKSGEAAMKTLNGDLGEELDPILEGLGLHAMGWTESGYRHITTNNIEATTPAALKGLSIRTQENPIHMASFQAWGASPTPMAFSELFTALQQGAVDAEENPLAVITANRLYEVQNTVTLTGHFYTAGIFNINKDFYESLEGQDKEWFDEASEHFVQNLTQLIRDAQEGYIQLLKDNGINVVEVTSEQKDAFIESAASVYDLFIEKYGGTQELIDLAMKYNDDFSGEVREMRAWKFIEKNFEKWFLIISLVAMVLIIFMQVVLRWFHAATVWAEELARYIMLYQVWIGASYAVHEDAHIRITALIGKLTGNKRRVSETVVLTLWLIFALWLTVEGVQLVKEIAIMGQVSSAMRIPMTIPYASVPLGGALMSIRLVQKLIQGMKDGPQEEIKEEVA